MCQVEIIHNASAPILVEAALQREKGSKLTDTGALSVRSGARAMLVGTTIADCQALGDYSAGGGINAYSHANVTLQGGSRIERCRAVKWGGGMVVYDGAYAELLEGSIVSECSSRTTGGVDVYLGHSHLRMVQSSILNCSAHRCGGVAAMDHASVLAINSVRSAIARTQAQKHLGLHVLTSASPLPLLRRLLRTALPTPMLVQWELGLAN